MGVQQALPLRCLGRQLLLPQEESAYLVPKRPVFHEGPALELEPGMEGGVLVIQDFRGHLPWGENPHHLLALGSELPTRVHWAVTLIWL